MSERLQILYMQARLVRLAAEEWHMTIKAVNKIFQQFNVYHYIADLWGLFHVEGDYAVLEDIQSFLSSKGEEVWLKN